MSEPLWEKTMVSACETYHIFNHNPLYSQRFHKVMKYHFPGLAPVRDPMGAFHINMNGQPAYLIRFIETFGFYEGLAAVRSKEGWFHIWSNGEQAYTARYLWCGNFQEGLCSVRANTGLYFHIDHKGKAAYLDRYRYAGDFKDSFAVVSNKQGLHTHIDQDGKMLHECWFIDLDIFHKGYARAKDAQGWFHIDKTGKEIYAERYANIEPFYNGCARVETFANALFIIDIEGKIIHTLREKTQISSLNLVNPKTLTQIQNFQSEYKGPKTDLTHELSADLVGYWKTQTIAAAVKLGVIDALPNVLSLIASNTNLDKEVVSRLLRALWELNIAKLGIDNIWNLTPKGQLLKPTETSSMAAAAMIWGNSHYYQWQFLVDAIRDSKLDRTQYFYQLVKNSELLSLYQTALRGYALQDYKKVFDLNCWNTHQHVIDAGGGTGTLLHQLCNRYIHLKGHLLDLPGVIQQIPDESKLKERCQYIGIDFFEPWKVSADAIIFARVLHDWPDQLAIRLLKRAKEALLPFGKVYILELILDENSPNGGLLDLNMLVMTGGRERTLNDWRAIIEMANLVLTNVQYISPVISVLTVELYQC